MSINDEKNEDWLLESIIDKKIIKSMQKNIDKTIKKLDPVRLDPLSTRGEKSIQYSLTDYLDEKIITKIKKLIKPEYKKLFDVKDIDLNYVSAWTVIGGKYSYHKLHDHIHGRERKYDNIAVVIYLESPTERDFHYPGDFYYLYEDKQTTNYIKYTQIQPVTGTLIVMPSWLHHGALPALDKRQTLNLEFEMTEL
jgi:hypothetical protein